MTSETVHGRRIVTITHQVKSGSSFQNPYPRITTMTSYPAIPDPISSDIRDRLHGLPIRSRIDFKLGILVYKCLHGNAPPYLVEMLQ